MFSTFPISFGSFCYCDFLYSLPPLLILVLESKGLIVFPLKFWMHHLLQVLDVVDSFRGV